MVAGRMRLLDRYLFREVLVPLGFCLGGFLIFWISFDLFGQLDEFQKWNLSSLEIAQYYLYDLPVLLNTALPVALLLATLYALTTHARHHELTAMRAAGISLWRICLPYFVLGLGLSLALLWINEQVMVDGPERKRELTQRHSNPEGQKSARWRDRVNFRNPSAQRDWSLGSFQLDSGELRQVRVGMPLPQGAYREVTAISARWTNGYWRLTNGIERIYRENGDPLPAEKPKPIFTLSEMGGPPGALALWKGTPVYESNQLVAVTRLVRKEERSQEQWTLDRLILTNSLAETLRFSAPLESGARRVIMAEGGSWTNGQWRFRNAREFLSRSGTDGDVLDQFHPEIDLPELGETPDMIRSEVRVGELLARTSTMRRGELPVRDVLDYLQLHPNLNKRDRALLDTQLHARIASPWTCLVVSVIAIPFGAPSGRRNIFYGVAGSLALGFLYFAVQRLGYALGQSGLVTAWLAAWLPNLCFGTVGVWLTSRVR